MTDVQAPVTRRPIRSFVRRGGRTTQAQARAHTTWGERFLVPYSTSAPDWDAVFGRQAPRVLEIGFGMGETTAALAAAHPELDFIACEVHEPGIGALLAQLGAQGSSHVRIVAHDAVEVLQAMIAPQSLRAVHVFFPDPWPKKRHHKRRLIQGPLVEQLAHRLEPGGMLHLATDWQPYAQHMLEVLQVQALLVNTATAASGFVERPSTRPLTKFERRGLRLGHGVWDLVFRRA